MERVRRVKTEEDFVLLCFFFLYLFNYDGEDGKKWDMEKRDGGMGRVRRRRGVKSTFHFTILFQKIQIKDEGVSFGFQLAKCLVW